MIKLINVSAEYRAGDVKTTALKGVTLSITKPGIYAIMGKSGSGKTTLLKTVSTLLRPASGQVLVDGVDIYKLSEKKLARFRLQHFGFIYQNYELLPELTAYENIALPLLIDRKKPDKKEIVKLCEKIGIEQLFHRFPYEMSGGEQQRIAIARAVVHKPAVLLCDEPTGNLDEENSKNIMDTIQILQKQTDSIVLLVTHDREIAHFADQIITIRDGVLREGL